MFFSDCAVLDKENWTSMEGAQSVIDCKSVCSEDDLKWQWIHFDNNLCYCIQLLEKGHLLYSINNVFRLETSVKHLIVEVSKRDKLPLTILVNCRYNTSFKYVFDWHQRGGKPLTLWLAFLLNASKYIFNTPSLGFWPPDTCPTKTVGTDSGTVHRIFNISCQPLPDLPDKKVFLRNYDQQFLMGSRATYDCMAGYSFPDGVCLTKFNFCKIILLKFEIKWFFTANIGRLIN